MKVKFSIPEIYTNDINHVSKILKSGWLTHGKYNDFFENNLKIYRLKICYFCFKLYSWLHLSCLSIGLKGGDEVIVPSQTHTATAHAVEYTGAKAIFSDVDPITGNILEKEFEKKITNKTKAIIIVHMAGYPCKIKDLISLWKKKKLHILEDCAHALGTTYKKKHVGNFGITGSFSFYPTKQVTTGEGGMVITNNKQIYNKIKKLKAFGINKDIKLRKRPGEYNVTELGFNYRITDFQACLGYMQQKI